MQPSYIKKQLLFWAFLTMTAQAYTQWSVVPSGTTTDFQDVHFPNDSVGYIVGNYGITLRSLDAGDSWEITHVDSTIHFQSVFFVNENKGFAAGGDLFQTIDGGITWERILTDTFLQMMEVYFVNETLGFASGTELYTTRDGGLSWNGINLDNTFSSIYFPTDSVGYFIGGPDFGSPLYKTNDAGETFIPIANGFQSIKESVHFIDENTGYMCGWYAGIVAKTTNGGMDWELLDLESGSQCWGVHFADENTGYYINNSGGSYIIRKTINGGADWTTQTLESNGGLYAFYFFDANTAVAVGSNGKIFKTENGGEITGIHEGHSFNAINVYPNPVKEELMVEIEGDGDGLYSMAVYSILSHNLISIHSGESITSIDIADLPAGIYLVVISNEKGFRTIRKIVKG